ncbi:MAG: hypothetical protein K2K35_05590, partial [Lachnospiraceae bacterium]|nr:hypothetical protein [Lachnospiraceae bacterium]
STDTSTSSASGEELKNVTDKAKEALDSFDGDIEAKAEEVLNNTDNKLSTILNEKIMGLSEYSDQILDKMEKNHSETVFLYDMLNEKEKEIKELVHDIDVLKADIRDELAKEYQEHRKRLEETGGSIPQAAAPVYNNGILPDELYGISTSNANTVPEDTIKEGIIAMPVTEAPYEDANDTNPSMYDVEIARIEEQEIREKSLRRLYGNMGISDIQAAAIEAGIDHVDHSDEIISLYKKGRSVLEISKMLDIGQGEVKFVIDMYKAS